MADRIGEILSENAPLAPSVQPIDKRSVHQICSGQVVLNLATAVKELVENSLDAGAKNIEVKLKENGADVVEVIDNGYGVKPENFAALTLKHYTSKLRDFSDLANVETFGFRGEALSSLCALSDLSIMTRHSSETVGTKLEYDHNGKILSKSPCAREHGTTVTLHNLFTTLPVRHKEFLRNLKKEYVRLLQVLHAYCVISCGVRISCSNQLDKGRRSLLVATNGSLSVKDNITCVFGPKQIQSLLPIQQVEPSEDDCEVYGLDPQEVRKKTNIFQISGYVSKADHGMGRSSADRQFFFINKRPCDFVKVSRVVNEVYHMYNRNQYPFVVMDISLARDSVDVNVTPNKRQVFIQEEKLLLSIIKTSLKKMFEPSGSTYNVNQGFKNQTKLASSISVLRQGYKQDENCRTKHVTARDSKDNLIRSGNEKGVFPSLANFKRKFGMSGIGCNIKNSEPRAKQAKLTAMFSPSVEDENVIIDQPTESCGSLLDLTNGRAEEIGGESDKWQARSGYIIQDNGLRNASRATASSELGVKPDGKVIASTEREGEIPPSEDSNTLTLVSTSTKQLSSLIKNVDESGKVEEVFIVPDTEDSDIFDSPTNYAGETEARNCRMKTSSPENFAEIVTARKSLKIDFNLKELQRVCKTSSWQRQTQAAKARLFRAKISPESSQNAEEELQKHVSKEMFSKMEILGQFNLGFIITKSGDDLFLIDQHASDEKYNFEDQQRNSMLKSQKLILPQHLELTAINESILADNLEVFRKNGFDFVIDENAAPTKRVRLTSLPMSKNWTFGVEDVEELVFMLSDSPGTMCRPSRVRKMFASRACRMSVMVGTALDRGQMRRIVGHMGLMDQPWNCPHGRPTMRHLINLRMISSPE